MQCLVALGQWRGTGRSKIAAARKRRGHPNWEFTYLDCKRHTFLMHPVIPIDREYWHLRSFVVLKIQIQNESNPTIFLLHHIRSIYSTNNRIWRFMKFVRTSTFSARWMTVVIWKTSHLQNNYTVAHKQCLVDQIAKNDTFLLSEKELHYAISRPRLGNFLSSL